MKKIIEHFTHFGREFLIISLSLLLLINTVTSYYNKTKFELQSIENKKLRNESDSLKSINDSLSIDNINMDMELHRHEMTRDEVFLKYPKVGEEYEYFLGHYTE
jgi:maltodextrin utilization protein YvdJ